MAAPASHYIRTRDGSLKEMPDVSAQFVLEEGESIISNTAGGGGYGSPLSRDPGRVGKDVKEGWVSVERAFEVYGVVLNAEGGVDFTATNERRNHMNTP